MAWHAKKSASGSKQWMKCAGSLPLVDGMDSTLRRPTGTAAMTGTCAHALGEQSLRNGVRTLDEGLIGTIIWLDENEDATVGVPGDEPVQFETRSQLSAHLGVDVKFFTVVDEKMLEGVQLYLDTVWADFDEMGDTCEMSIEVRLDMEWLRPGLGGTSDCTLYQFLGLLRVIDYKNGYVNVEAEDNTQGLKYALGEAHRVDWMFEDCEVVIVQPNTRIGAKVKRFRVTKEELRAFQDRLAEASDRVDEAAEALGACQDQADFTEWAGTYLDAGTAEEHDHCTWCDAFATCPAAQAIAENEAMADFADDPPDFNPVEVHDDESLERLRRLIKWGDYLDKLVKAAQTLGQRRLEQGLEMPGYKLVHGKANRAYDLPEGEVVAAMTKAGFEKSELYEEPKPPKLKSPAQMEKLGAARSAQRKKAKELVDGVWDKDKEDWKVKPLAVKPLGKVTMAPETDPREAIVPGSAVDDFVDDIEHDYGEEQ